MAIAFVRDVGSATGTAVGDRVGLAPGVQPIAAGNLCVVLLSTNGGGSGSDIWDTLGNKWYGGLVATNSGWVGLFASVLQTQITSADTIFYRSDGGTNFNYSYQIAEFSGVASAQYDATAIKTASGTQSFSVGPTLATTQADELCVAAFGFTGTQTSFAMTAPYTSFANPILSTTSGGADLGGGYQIIAATGAQSAAAAITATNAFYRALLATFKGGALTHEVIAAPGLIGR